MLTFMSKEKYSDPDPGFFDSHFWNRFYSRRSDPDSFFFPRRSGSGKPSLIHRAEVLVDINLGLVGDNWGNAFVAE